MSDSMNFDYETGLRLVLTKDSVIINCKEDIAERDIRYKLSSFPSIASNWIPSSRQLILFNHTGGNINFSSLFFEICKSFEGKKIDSFILHSIRELKKIREFLKGGKQTRRSEVLGLYAEMLVFKKLLAKLQSERQLLAGWGRPERHPQDFVLSETAYEVKFKGRAKVAVRVDSERQLDFDGDLFLIIVSADSKFDIEKEECAFKNLYTQILSDLSEEGKEAFRSKIKVGDIQYDSGIHSLGLIVSTLSSNIYIVNDEFPRITPRDLPDGISKVSYTINTDLIKKFIDNEYFK